jgi:hypothetical protein
VDSLKHFSLACPIDAAEELGLASRHDVFGEVCEQDDFDELLRHLSLQDQRTLRLLRMELTLQEIARQLCVSHVTVIDGRRRIRATAAGLGIHP